MTLLVELRGHLEGFSATSVESLSTLGFGSRLLGTAHHRPTCKNQAAAVLQRCDAGCCTSIDKQAHVLLSSVTWWLLALPILLSMAACIHGEPNLAAYPKVMRNAWEKPSTPWPTWKQGPFDTKSCLCGALFGVSCSSGDG